MLGHSLQLLQLLLSHLGAQNTGSNAVWLVMQIKDLGVKAGVVLNPATPIEAIQHVITQVDLILLMSGKLCGHNYIVPCLLVVFALAEKCTCVSLSDATYCLVTCLLHHLSMT